MDYITNLPISANGCDSILTMVDRFSKFVILLPCKISINAADVAKLIFDNVICKYGVLKKIISHRDVRFQSLFWKNLIQLFGCKLNMSSAFHP